MAMPNPVSAEKLVMQHHTQKKAQNTILQNSLAETDIKILTFASCYLFS